MTSTPGIKDTSQIYEYWLESDQRKPYVKCPICGADQFLNWDQFRWKGKDDKHNLYSKEEKLKSLEFECSECKQGFTDKDFDYMPPVVEWKQGNPGSKTIGFHINAFYTNPRQENFTKYLDAGQNQAKLMVWWNTTLGLPYNFEALATLDWQALQNKEKFYHRGTVPEQVVILLAGCDVQHDRVEVTVAGVIKNQLSLIIM